MTRLKEHITTVATALVFGSQPVLASDSSGMVSREVLVASLSVDVPSTRCQARVVAHAVARRAVSRPIMLPDALAPRRVAIAGIQTTPRRF